ncbi:hypothetical protein DL96DRAFT_1810972 [Flagelloscypha sp. PMI_526]|nr:hypothetical protein DL96DRAFT_1810972 [Flagelloscypha sp. PMI_526]
MASTALESASYSPSLPEVVDDDINLARPLRSSIDESLELEHALNSESLPPTPAYHTTTHSIPERESVGGIAFDPGVLAHIISQLRSQLKEVTAERDMLARPSEELEYKEALASMTEKATRLEDELSIAKKQNEDDREAISLLRTKVEESRRGLMKLQSQSKRQSTHGAPPTLDLARANSFHFSSVSTPKSTKRASFTPLTGTLNTGGHRRVLSGDGSMSPRGPSFAIDPATPSGSGQDAFFPPQDSSPPKNRRLSSIFASPRRSVSPDGDPELEALRREVKNLKDTLEETRAELSEAVEAKDAADACATALREFINTNNQWTLPPLPDAAKPPAAAQAAGWGFGKLFQKPAIDTTSLPPASVTSSAASSPNVTATQPALSRKIGSFFASRSNSISSTTSSFTGLQSNAATGHVVPAPGRPSIDARASVYSMSDASSTEPISPIGEEDRFGVKVRTGSEEGSPVTNGGVETTKPLAAVAV